MKKKTRKIGRYNYRTHFVGDPIEFKEKVLSKTIIPHQVEVQPGGPTNGNLCWLPCPYCYGISAKDSGERLSRERYIEILLQIAEGGVNKIAFAGYATDPLNCEYIEDLFQVALDYKQISGFHTKALKISERLISQITHKSIAPKSFFNVSVDAGNNETYNSVHGVPKSKAKLYDKVLDNLCKISSARKLSGAPLDISTTYLINNINNSTDEILKAISDLRNVGADMIRFTFPQVPRGYSMGEKDQNIPKREEILSFMNRLEPILEAENSEECEVLIMDLDADYEIENARTLPCVARFIYPTIGFDGWFYHCSESAAPQFKEMALGNLAEKDFWDLYYSYDTKHFQQLLQDNSAKMNKLSCKCDRKEHAVNSCVKESGVFGSF